MEAAMDIGRQIRALRAQVRAPLRDAAGTPHCLFTAAAKDKVAARGEPTGDPDGFACVCANACAYIWTSGFQREGDTVGVHMFRFTNPEVARWSPAEWQRETMKSLREADAFLAQIGMPAALRARNWSTPPDSTYQLSREEAAVMTANTAFSAVLRSVCRNPDDIFPAWEPLLLSNDPGRSVCYRKKLLMLMRLGTAHYLGRVAS